MNSIRPPVTVLLAILFMYSAPVYAQTTTAPTTTAATQPAADKGVAVPLEAVDPVLALALSPDGHFLAIGADSGAVVIWNLQSGRPLRGFHGHRASAQSVAFSPDGRQLLSASSDNTAILWDIATGGVIQTFKGHTDQVMSAAFSPDGRRIITGSMDKTAIIWNARSGEKILTIIGHTGQVYGVAYSPDGKTVATGSLDRTGALWDAETGKSIFVLRGHPEEVSCIAFSADGKLVATGSFDNSAIIWDTATGKKLIQTAKHDIDVYGVTFTPDGTGLVTCARDEVAILWDVKNARKIRTFRGHNSDVGASVVSRDGRMLFTCSRDGMVKLWDMATGVELASLMTDASTKSWAVVVPNGLFDASEPGRRMMGFRFAKGAGTSLDQIFNQYFRPSLLTEIYQGHLPIPGQPLGHSLSPLVKILSPKTRSAITSAPITITVEAGGQSGGGVSSIRLFNNGIPIAVQHFPVRETAQPIEAAFENIPLLQGANQIRAVADNEDGSWQSAPAEIELTYTRPQRSKSRLYVVAIGTSAQPLAQMLHDKASDLYDRVDLVPLLDPQATQGRIEEAVADVASLTKPQDSLILIIERPGVPMDILATQIGSAAALNRAMILDLPAPADSNVKSQSVRRGTIERLSRGEGIYMIASLNEQGVLSRALVMAAPQAMDVMEWFNAAADRAGAQCSSQAKGFPLFAAQERGLR